MAGREAGGLAGVAEVAQAGAGTTMALSMLKMAGARVVARVAMADLWASGRRADLLRISAARAALAARAAGAQGPARAKARAAECVAVGSAGEMAVNSKGAGRAT